MRLVGVLPLVLATAFVAAASSGPARPATPTGSLVDCRSSQLTITRRPLDGGAGHQASVLVFRNTGTPCTLEGYPSVNGVDARGRVVLRFQHTRKGYYGGPARAGTVLVPTGGTASALIEGLTSPPSGQTCPTYDRVRITPPDETHSALLRTEGYCQPQVHPLTRGSRGR